MSITEQPATTEELEERVALLARSPLFAAHTRDELSSLAVRFREVTRRKGEVLFHEGDEGGDFYIVVRGELEVWGGGATKRVVNRLGPGDHLGEIALLLGGGRTATVRVSRPVRLLAMDGAEFRTVTERDPKMLAFISRALSRQLAARTRGEVAHRSALTIGVTSAPGLRGKSLVAHALAALLPHQAGMRTLLIEAAGAALPGGGARVEQPASDGHAGGVPVAIARAFPRSGRRWRRADLATVVEQAHRRYPLVVLELGSRGAASPRVLSEVCDVVVEVVANAGDDPPRSYRRDTRVIRVVNLHNPSSRRFPVNRCEPFLLPDDPELRGLTPQDQARHVLEEPRSPAGAVLHRLARKVRGATVGLALAGGAAFGLGHVGVLLALEAAGIPIDIVAGTSMGSIVGGAYAIHGAAAEVEELVLRLGTKRKALSALDFRPGQPALLAGARFRAILGEMGLEQRFEDLRLPFQAVACDIESGERVPIGTGLVADACRASASLPVIFKPIRDDGRTLVDGGVVDLVPTALVREMGADVCIAVTVVPTLHRGAETAFTRLSHRVNALNPVAYAAGTRRMPAMLDLFMNSLQMLQYELGNFEALSADAWIEVDTTGFTWVDFHCGRELSERGTRATRAALPELQRMLAERPALAG